MTKKKEATATATVTCGDCGKKHPEGTLQCECGYKL